MKISIIKPVSVNVDPWIDEFRNQDCQVVVNNLEADCDFLIGASHSQLNNINAQSAKFPKIPIVNYNWDLYGWVDVSSHAGYNWKGYGDLLARSAEIWCPSEEVILRTEEFFGLGKKCHVIKTFARFFEYKEIKDLGYVYQTMRHYTKDKNFGWTKKACRELSIPFYESNHSLSEAAFQKVVASCRLMCNEYYEASTGGLTLLEGYRLGKPVIISNSPYMGAKDYFGDRAIYFDHNDYENFKKILKHTWENAPKLNVDECRAFTDQYSLREMVSQMVGRLKILKEEND